MLPRLKSRLPLLRDVLIAGLLSALVWPGAGQLYNREFKKASALFLLTILLGVSLMIGLGREVLQALPPNPTPFDPEQLKAMRNVILHANPGFYRNYSFLLSATWIYGVMDAVLGARERAFAKNLPDEARPDFNRVQKKIESLNSISGGCHGHRSCFGSAQRWA